MENYDALMDELASLNTQKQEIMKQMQKLKVSSIESKEKEQLNFITKSETPCVNLKVLIIVLRFKSGITNAVIMIGITFLKVLLSDTVTKIL